MATRNDVVIGRDVSAGPPSGPGLVGRFAAFVAEHDPHALAAATEAFRVACPAPPAERDAAALEALRPALRHALAVRLPSVPAALPDPTPGVPAVRRLAQ